jgi:hypothetical protein
MTFYLFYSIFYLAGTPTGRGSLLATEWQRMGSDLATFGSGRGRPRSGARIGEPRMAETVDSDHGGGLWGWGSRQPLHYAI